MHLVSSAGCNAWSLLQGLFRLGIAPDDIRVVSSRAGHLCRGIVPSLPALPDALAATDCVYPTEEHTLARVWAIPTPPVCMPSQLGALPLDDKIAFHAWLDDQGEQGVPWAPYRAGQASPFGYPAALRLRHSWRGGQRRPKGEVLHRAEEEAPLLRRLERAGVATEELFWQAFIAGPPQHNISVSGWHGPGERDPVYLVSRKVAQDREPIGTAVAVEQIRDPGGLVDRSARLLETLAYTGPFELEFLATTPEGPFLVLELNPRYWMQHGLIIDHFDNAVLARAMGRGEGTPHGPLPHLGVGWLHTTGWMEGLARGHTGLLPLRRRLTRQGPLSLAPGWGRSMRYLAGRIPAKVGIRPAR